MTRNKDTESHQRMTTVQEFNIVEKAREVQDEIEEEIELRNRKMSCWKRKWRRNNRRDSKQLQIADEVRQTAEKDSAERKTWDIDWDRED